MKLSSGFLPAIGGGRGESMFTMANVSKKDTGLPYDIWIDSEGVKRKPRHKLPTLMVDCDGSRIPVSIETTPKILVHGRTIPEFEEVSAWIIKYSEVLLRHWNKEISDREALNLLGR